MIHEKQLFLQKFIHQPKQIGSIIPSSALLARSMTAAIPWEQVRYAAELGAGTGAITARIQQVADPSAKVFLFEQDQLMRDLLAGSYPAFLCYPSAEEILPVIRKHGVSHLDCILSGLPFFNFPQTVRDQILSQIEASLAPGGWFVAFQYSLQMKKQLAARFDIEDINFVLLNLPPAFVYVCRTKGNLHEC
ncbi:phospholipid methyltransferase [Paenibacillus thiaminolyticus]|uniref:class I SAM-dependent methyltransferase n=1 Tax=Paenibacillus thiaminolyticus TaxID=49283 RepID=UPI0011623A58|nr:phospholipid methyltransferase [Paenibacillus thiaminolyticus]NGP59545.1 phospholipid methyltransferase [Paenibacillus thiaminolyticus]